MQAPTQQSSQVHLFLSQKEPLRRNNITVVEMNKSRIKFLNKYLSRSEIGTYNSAQASAPVQQYNLQFRMKQKFEQLYKRIQKISKSMSPDDIKGKIEKRFIVIPNQQISESKKADFKQQSGLHQELIRLGYRTKVQKNLKPEQEQPENIKLEINNTAEREQQLASIRLVGNNTRYRHRLVSVIKPAKMSNNIKDYLSVQKIRLKDLEDSIVEKHHNIIKSNKMRASLYSDLAESFSNQIARTALPTIPLQKNTDAKLNVTTTKYMLGKNKKFQPPFETYYYRDLVWRVAYSNEKILEFPAEYQAKIKVFIGRGNNSRLVKSIVARRSWYQVTDRIEEAHFIWTQIKVQSVFASQTKVKYLRDADRYKSQSKSDHYIKSSIWSHFEHKAFKKYFDSYRHSQGKMSENMKFRNKTMAKVWEKKHEADKKDLSHYSKNSIELSSCSMPSIGLNQQASTISTTSGTTSPIFPRTKIQNHFINSYLIGNKKALFQTMSDYYTKIGDNVFNYLPLTFHISNGLEDDNYLKFLNTYYALAKKTDGQDRNSKFNAWIVKPGENTNRGQGITVCLTLESIKGILKRKDKHTDGSNKTYIVQKYIQRPMLYKRRKFDMRHYIMINCSNGFVKGYWFKEGYVRTTSSEYTLKQGFGSVHLTNDAVQKNLPEYGKYEKGNKISYEELDLYLSKMNSRWSFWDQAYPKMKKIATDVIRASASSLDPDRRTNFEIYGLDFMIDQQMQVSLIQVNTNPCLQLSCPLLAKIIPKMIESTLEICIDPLYPPPLNFSPKGTTFKKNCVEEIDYELVYDDRFEETNLSDNRLLNDQSLKKEEDDCFQDDGEDWNQD